MANTAKINHCAVTGSVAVLQARHELAKERAADPKLPNVETDEMNENDVRVRATAGDNATPWVRAKDAEAAIKAWNDANPAK